MRYLAAYLLSALSGNKEPSVDEISTILGSVGIEVDEERAKKVVSELKGKDLSQVISEGSKKFASVPTSGGSAAVLAPAAPAAASTVDSSPVKNKPEPKKEEKKEESESEDDMGFGLFD